MFQIEFDAQQIEEALPNYRYIKRLGSGSFATVHLVADRNTNEQWALKKVSCFGMGEYEKAGAANEVRILSSLDHKNIIKVDSCLFDNNDDVLYMFMEYASSGDLSELIRQAMEKRKRLPQQTIWKAINDISDALSYLHKNQIIHRDVKPANIFRKAKLFKVGDMNVAKVLKGASFAVTKTGSPLYTAPEVWQSESYGQKCDLWSLGVLIYQMCCLRVPYQADNVKQMVRKIKTQKPKNIPIVYSSSLNDLIKRMLEVNPSKRISAEEVFKIACEKLKVQIQANQIVQNMMDTIVFPESHQRWINIPLPPKLNKNINSDSLSKRQKQGSRGKDRSKQRDRSYEREQTKMTVKNMSVKSIERQSSRKRQKNPTQTEEPNIFNEQRSAKRIFNLPRSRSRKQREKKTIFDETKVKLPTILLRASKSKQRKRSTSNSGSACRNNPMSDRIKRKMSGQFVEEVKRMMSNNN